MRNFYFTISWQKFREINYVTATLCGITKKLLSHIAEKCYKMRSRFLRKNQHFFRQINVFTKELISRKFLPFFLGYNSAEHNLLYFQICITFTWFQFITIFSHFFEMFLFSFTYFLMSRWPLLYFCLLAAQQYSVYWRNLLSLSEKYDDASDIRRRADF